MDEDILDAWMLRRERESLDPDDPYDMTDLYLEQDW